MLGYYKCDLKGLGLLAVLCAAWASTGCSDSPATNDTPTEQELPAVGEVSACGSLDAAAASQIARDNTSAVLKASAQRADFLNSSALLSSLLQIEPGTLIKQDEIDDSINDLTTSLRDHLLAEGNVESVSGATVNYVLRPEVTCDTLEELLVDYDPTEAQMQRDDCLASYQQHPRRLSVTRVDCEAGDTVKLAYFSGDSTVAVAQVLLAPEALQVDVDVAQYLALLAELNSQTTDPITVNGASGELRGRLELSGATGLSAQLSLPTAASVDFDKDTENLHFGAGAAPAMAVATLDSQTKTVDGQLAAFSLYLRQPLQDWLSNWFDSSALPTATSQVLTSVPEAKGHLHYDGTTDRLVGAGLSLGDSRSTMVSESATLVSVEVAPDSDHQVDFEASAQADGTVLVAVPKGFGLQLTYALAPVAAQAESLPSFSTDDVVTLQTPAATSVTLLEDPNGDFAISSLLPGPVMRLDSGELSMTSTHYPEANLTVPAGQCLLQLDATPNLHEMFGDMSAGSCQ
jgi:hypothetical protein